MADAHVEEQRGAGVKAFHAEDVAFESRPVDSAVLDRPGRGNPTLFRKNLVPALTGPDVAVHTRRQPAGVFELQIEIVVEELPNPGPELDGAFGK
jgi:hypothetical protein